MIVYLLHQQVIYFFITKLNGDVPPIAHGVIKFYRNHDYYSCSFRSRFGSEGSQIFDGKLIHCSEL